MYGRFFQNVLISNELSAKNAGKIIKMHETQGSAFFLPQMHLKPEKQLDFVQYFLYIEINLSSSLADIC